MAVNLVTVTGTLETLIGSAPTSAQLWFKLDRPDWNDAGEIFAPEHVAATITTGGAFTVALQSTDDYSNGATYTAILRYRDDNDGRQREYVLSSFTLPSGGPYQLGDLLVTNPASSFNPNLNFTTRAAFIAAIPTLTHLQDGQSVFAGGYVYVRQSASTSIADAPGFIPGQFGDVIAAPSVLPYPIQPSMSGRTEDASRNVAAINAALAESASTGRQVKTPAGLFPINAQIQPPTGLPFYWINDRRTIFQPIYDNTNGFLRPAAPTAEMTDCVIENLTIRPAIDPGTGNPYIGNGIVGIFRRARVYSTRIENYWGDQAYLLLPYDCSFQDTSYYTTSTSGGTGAVRILGGANTVFTNTYGHSGDDGPQLTPAKTGIYANRDIDNVVFNGGVCDSNGRPFIILVDETLTCSITNSGFVGMRGIAGTADWNQNAESIVIGHRGPSGVVSGILLDNITIDERGRTGLIGVGGGVKIQGAVTHSTINVHIESPDRRVATIESWSGTGRASDNNVLRISCNDAPRAVGVSSISHEAGTRNTIIPRIVSTATQHGINILGGDRTRIMDGHVSGIPSGFAGVRDSAGTNTDVSRMSFSGSGNPYNFAATPATTGRVFDCDLGGLATAGAAPTLSNNRA